MKLNILSDKGIRTVMAEAMADGQDYGDDGKPLPERRVAQETVRQIVEILEAYQITLDRGDKLPMIYFRLLETDWQELKALAEVKKPKTEMDYQAEFY